MNIQNKTFVITGAAGGIGAALTRQILAKGGNVAAIDLNKDSLEALASAAGETAQRLSLHDVDITNKAAVEMLPRAVVEAHGSIDAIINNAGIIQPFVTIADLDYDTIERVMNVNFYGSLFMTKTFLPHLLQRPEGYIITVSSMGGFLPVPGQSVYGASKAAVKLLSEGLYAELQDTNVHVSTVFPGATNTDITKNSQVAAPTAQQSANTPTMLSSDAAATIILRGIKKTTPLIYTGNDSRMMQRIYRLSPIRATKLIASKMQDLLK